VVVRRHKLNVRALALVLVAGVALVAHASAARNSSARTSHPAKVASAPANLTNVKLVLAWLPQSEFAGFYVAQAKGWYAAHGVNLTILPGGPDLQNPVSLLTTGAADIAISGVSQVYTDQAAGVPLEDIMQYFEGPGSLYIARKSSGIKTLQDMVGKSVGLWFGGDEFEFEAMLAKAGVDKSKVHIFGQGATVVPWLAGKYDVMQVTPYNELQEVLEKVPMNQLNIFSAQSYGVAVLGDSVVATKTYADQNRPAVQGFLDATAEGWSWAIEHPKEAAQIVVKAVPTLQLPFQEKQMAGMASVICTGPTLKANEGLGYIDPTLMAHSYGVIQAAGELKKPVPVASGYDESFWKKIPKQYVHPKCP
jgi:NitT/TauT family transport system substrate-binding protein